ncbi:hypothetical protein ACFQL9_13140 [Halobaculum lipolyticum]|uniref:EVE domain-containing protein n=1 Tax=Halobaculum lipolyticum TaxID=3032001 RepID=A0ABD5WBF5_9EURY
MAKNIFLVPVTLPEFKRSVYNKIDLSRLPIEEDTLSNVESPDGTRVWGVKNSQLNKKFYDKMTSGDHLLFYSDDKYRYYGTVGSKFSSNSVSREYWGDITADLLYTVERFTEIELSREKLNEACGYKLAYQPQSIRRISSSASWELRKEHGKVEDFINSVRRA